VGKYFANSTASGRPTYPNPTTPIKQFDSFIPTTRYCE
jgi:hypothetical protein